jgi:maleate cis-trans isomerase
MENIGEKQFYRILPDGVLAHFVRISRRTPTIVTLEDMIMGERLEYAAKLVADASPDLIVWDDHSWSFEKGLGWDEKIAERIHEITGIPAITMSTAVVKALKVLKVSKVSAVGPWNDEKVERLKEFHNGHGIQIVRYTYVPPEMLLTMPEQAYYTILRQADTDLAEGLLACFSGERSLGVAELVEQDTGKPVIGAVTATVWYALRKLGIQDSVSGWGSLLRTAFTLDAK